MRTERAGVHRYLMRQVSDALSAYGSDVALARKQHAAYAAALRDAGAEAELLAADPRQADCCFVEDNVIVAGKRALLTWMGREDRRPESDAVAAGLEALGYEIVRMTPPATLEGGDVLAVAGRLFVGRSGRTNAAGVRALEEFAGISCVTVPVERCLHLKTAVTEAAPGLLLVNPAWVDPSAFAGLETRPAAHPNVLRVGNLTLVSSPETAAALPDLETRLLEISEFQKADAGLTCLSARIV